MAERRKLGKGLSTLIPTERAESSTPTATDASASVADLPASALRDVPTGSIQPNPNQPRVHFDEESLKDLANSIKEIGILQPLLVREISSGSYQLIAGERRWRAAQRAKLAEVPVVVC
jgi:ParB family transcriptional regulator, chromosome partitioning protein